MADTTQQDRLRALFNSRHPLYDAHRANWERNYRAYLGGEAFKEIFLWQYEAESKEKNRERARRCAYENHTRDIIGRLASIIFSRKINRKPAAGNEARWEELNEDIDLRGNSRKAFISKVCFPLSQLFGWLPVLIDSTSSEEEAETEADRDDLGLRSYAVPIMPFSFLNWGVDAFGALEWVLIKAMRHEGGPLKGLTETTEFRLIDREKTQIWEEHEKKTKSGQKKESEYELVREVTHGLGEVPVVILYDEEPSEGNIVGLPSIQDSVDLSIQLFNWSSWKGEVALKSLYNMLAVPEDNFAGGEEKEKVVGPDWILTYPAGGSPPVWVSAPAEPVVVYGEQIKDMRRRIYELAGLDAGYAEERRSAMSGVALTIHRKPTEEKALRLGQNLQEFEEALDRMMFEVVEGDPNFESSVVYPKRYATRDTREALELLAVAEQSRVLPPSAVQRLAAGVVNTTDYAELSDADQEALEKEILDFDPRADEVEQSRRLKQAEVEELIPLEQARIATSKAHSEAMAEKAVEVEKLRQAGAARTQNAQLKADKEKDLAERERASSEAAKPKSKLGELLKPR